MESISVVETPTQSIWRDYLELCKPRVVALMLLTAMIGMLLAAPIPTFIPWQIFVFGSLGIALSAGSGAILNHIVDRHLDTIMRRTHDRPIAAGRITPLQALSFAAVLGITGLALLLQFVNPLTAVLTLFALIGYALIYTVFLKRATPQNIVIGGLAGAAPPLLGWTAVTGSVDYMGLLLVLIIFVWTPPHFWALAIYRHEEYAKANIPMLPVTHGIAFTKLSVMLYTLLLMGVSLLPFVVDMSGIIYLIGVTLLNLGFIYWAIRLIKSDDPSVALRTFHYSIFYLMLLFVVLLMDHYLPILT
ncbi:MAG: heme o synthase [Gammaproteobacteria bacterium]